MLKHRFDVRLPWFIERFGPFGYALHYVWWVTHNCVVHPLVGLLPIRPFFWLHDRLTPDNAMTGKRVLPHEGDG